MAKADIKMPEDFLLKLSRLGANMDSIAEAVLEAGGEVVLEKVQGNLSSVIGAGTKYDSRSTGELAGSLGLSPVKVDGSGNHDIKVGFAEPRSDGGSNAKIANILEYGKHGQAPKPFLKPAKTASRKECIRRTAANFDLLQVNPVKVSRRGGINYVFNGQHTIEIVAAVSGSRDTPVWCMVYDNMDYMMEADTFANQQKYVKPLLPYDIFVANLEAGNDKQLMIKALVESMDLSIGPTKALGTICAVSSLEEIYDKHGYHVLERTLMLCIGAWEGEQNSLSANMLKGVCRMVVAYGDSMRDDLFVEKVGRFSAKDISRTAKERRAGSLGYAEAMLLAYNRKMRYPLRWGKLYNKKGTEDMGPDVETDMEPEDPEDD